VTYTVDFASPRIGRYNFLARAGAIFCAGPVSIAVVAAPHDPIEDTAVIAGAFDHIPPPPASTTSSDQFLYQKNETWGRETDATGLFIVSRQALTPSPILRKAPYRGIEPIFRGNHMLC